MRSPVGLDTIWKCKKARIPIPPQKKKTEILFDRLHQFLFETLPYLIVCEISSSRMTPQIPWRIN